MGLTNFRKTAEQFGLALPKGELAFCEGCALRNAKKEPFLTPTRKYAPLERVNSDIAGRFVFSLDGDKYTFSYLEHSSRPAVTYFQPSKGFNTALDNFEVYRACFKRRYNRKILVHHFDHGGDDHCHLQQNGVVERLHYTIECWVCSILAGNQVPPFLWAEFWRT
ncbi:MAG: hypothetical protein BJ554DRAFT_6973 [Olpidium bornovanus]|uniref:Integrase catalytic domain-containing protein n=1 Tax=Olpidium bornovanus TaxID=278681 RepID=A0A8H7ZXQ4_9FUNG|nr:MAG: hypothetical protein BJ554DRAFT_6973 [Olpidium bornovanus]